jgi:hypothetical protein
MPLSGVPDGARRAIEGLPVDVAASFVRLAYRDLKNNPLAAPLVTNICERSVASEYPLSEWLSQINHVYQWLAERGSRGRLSDIVEYVSCAFEGTASHPGSFHPGTSVDWFLDNFGFARSTPIEG